MRSEHRELQRCPRGRHYRGLRAGRGETQVDARSERYLSVTVIPPAFVRKPAEFFPVSPERLSRLHSQGAGKRSADFLREADRGLCCGYRTLFRSLNREPKTGLVPLPRFGRISCAESLRLMPDAVFCRRNWTVWSRVRPDFAGRFSAFTLYAAHDIDKRKHRPRPALVRRKDEFRFRFGTGHGESEGRYIRLMRATGEMSIGANSPR